MPGYPGPSLDILRQFGVAPDAFIEGGRESEVFAVDRTRVLRVFREDADVADLARRRTLLARIDGRLPVATALIETIDPGGRFTVERRLRGISLRRRLAVLTGERRASAIRAYVAAARAAASVTLDDQPYGELLAAEPMQADTWTGFLRASLARFVAAHGSVVAAEVGDVDTLHARALALLAPVPERPRHALVHGDYFPGNVLMDDDLRVSGLVDFSGYALVGDPLYDTLSAPVFLEMIEEASTDDVAVATEAARKAAGAAWASALFYRAYAAFAMADPAYSLPPYPHLYPWAITNLRQLAEGAFA